MPGQWAGSDRRSTLPDDWPARRTHILQRDHYQCTWIGDLALDGRPNDYITATYAGIAHQITHRCHTRATDVDHIGDPHDHDNPRNLRSLCSWHHDRRSSRQGNAAKAERARLTLRPQRPHPGLR